jgi:hypothetical protein
MRHLTAIQKRNMLLISFKKLTTAMVHPSL